MKFFFDSILVGGFVFLAIVVGILYLLSKHVIMALVFKMKIAELLRWSGENPNSLTTEPEPAKLLAELNNLHKKLKGDWPWFIKKPRMMIYQLIHWEGHPNSSWEISGCALKKILGGGEVSECEEKEVILVGSEENV